MLAVTRRGAYLSPDGLAYVGTARNLLDGAGFSLPPGSPPLGNFPPVYPLILAAFGALGPDPLTVARFVGPVAFGATILVVGLLVRQLTGSMPLAVLAQLLVFTGTDFLAYHSAALSEPVFLLLALVTLAALGGCLTKRRSLLLLAAALLAGAACLTRYVGLAVVAAGALGLVLLASRRADGRYHWRGAIAFGALALAPLFGWLAWVSGEMGRATNREAVFHAPGLAYVTRGLRNASTWVLPAQAPTPVRFTAAALAVVALVVVAWRTRHHARRPGGLAGLLALFAVAYLAALAVDRMFFDVTGRLDSRFLLPVHV
ncbi:MAG: glycosyltransferase family 39 protein, partial [Actinomycetota bacterium]|nr:glycosyltransferase family 39 protein [Actinomycetota bacterium]